MADTFEWKSPDSIKGTRGHSKWFSQDAETKLRTRPGEWALIAENAPLGIQTRLKKSHPGFEFTARGIRDHVCAEVYARFLGIDQ